MNIIIYSIQCNYSVQENKLGSTLMDKQTLIITDNNLHRTPLQYTASLHDVTVGVWCAMSGTIPQIPTATLDTGACGNAVG
jgi:hypothetical protein